MRTHTIRFPRAALIVGVSAVVTLALAARRASAQSALPDSTRLVRVFYNSGSDYVTGRIVATTHDSIFVVSRRDDTLAIARRSVLRVQVASSESRADATIAGTGVGLLSGVALGVVIGRGSSMGDGMAPYVLAPVLGVAGAVVGGLVGYEAGARWRDVPFDVGLSRRGIVVGVSF